MADDDKPRTWEELHAAIITAVRAVPGVGPQKTRLVADAVAGVVDDEAVRRYTVSLLEQTRIRNMGIDAGGGLEMSAARDAVLGWVGAARTLLGDAPNYCETVMEFGLPETRERYAFTIQKIGKLTPHQARMQAENALAEARAELERLRTPVPGEEEGNG